MGDVVGRVGGIWRYPVKSMGGERLDRAELDALGVHGDRRFALRDGNTGKILSAKSPELGPTLLACRSSMTDDGLKVEVDGRTFGRDERDELDAVLSDRLGRFVRLESTSAPGDVYESYWPPLDGTLLSDVHIDLPVAMSTGPGTFVDLAALHVVATASVDHLAALAPEATVSMARFRPSFTVEGATGEGFVEDGWAGRTATVGSASLAFTTATPRCIMTTLDQPSLPREPQVLRTIAAHHRVDVPGLGTFACLGNYAEVTVPGTVATGDEVVLD
ncbi:MAG: MOSC domain-containing protein [Acidimicrobiia bacterium]|nr:MOSC domain-containing protein [Acidimicrobiia bacterium]